MRSIRRSLVLYFLALLGLGLGAVGLLVDRFARDAARSREEAEVGRIEQAYEVNRKETEERFDDELLDRAKTLGRELDAKFSLLARRDEEFRRDYSLLMDALHLGGVGTGWPAVGAIATAENRQARLAMSWVYLLNKSFEVVRSSFEGSDHQDYFRVHFARSKRVIHGPNPGPELPLDIDALNRDPAFESRAETVDADGSKVRRLVLKFRFATSRWVGADPGWWSRPPGPPPGPPRTEPRGDRRPPQDARRGVPDNTPFVYVQVGRDVADLDARTARHRTQRDDDLARVVLETRADTTRLRARLALIALVTCLALSVGGWLLVGWGLNPVRRLSDAVSRVSERDFRLPVERDELSHELLPIHAHLTDTLDDLRRAFEREKEAVADISHELRTPVAGMLATIDVALRKPRSADQYKTALEEVRAIGRQLAGLVERVMTLATLDAGGDHTTAVETDVAGVAERCAAVVRPLAVANGLKFEADLPMPVSVTTDPDKVREVVTNFLHNAVEYNRPGGTIRLSARPTPGGGAEVVVADTGIGMTPDVRDKIFERFYRADASRHAAGAHAGLGLSIVKEYVQRLGGAVAVESEAGVGSTFRLTLPAAVGG